MEKINGAWQGLIMLESRDAVTAWYKKVHERDISTEKCKGIIASARQGREYFANADRADYSVKALLIYYGVSSLARALTLLHMKGGSEASLARAHGLNTKDWPGVLSGGVAGISKIGDLEVSLGKGSFMDFVTHTQNRTDLHLFTSKVELSIFSELPKAGVELRLKDVLARVPDLVALKHADGRSSDCIAMQYGQEGGRAYISCWEEHDVIEEYVGLGYETFESRTTLALDQDLLRTKPLQIYNSYFTAADAFIPQPHLVSYCGGVQLSQMAQLYAVAYFMGMLSRYFPTHWMALMSGEKGDGIWPELYAAHNLIIKVYPALALDLIKVTRDRASNES